MTDLRSTRLCIGDELAAYGFGDGHPFGPDRMHAFRSEAQRRGLDRRADMVEPCIADEATILLFHTRAYLERVRRLSVTGEGWLDAGDTPAFKGMYEAAATVAGSVVMLADMLMAGACRRAFIPIAGLHHARRDGAAGFCVFNDCGIVIEHLKRIHGLTRIAYVDIDAHHGDGVFYAFEDDAAARIADIHEDGRYLYPGTGSAEEKGKGDAECTKLNLPLPPGATDDDFLRVWPEVDAHLEAAGPEFIILQCGADSIANDPITHLRLSPRSHAHAAGRLCRIADAYCDGRLLALGGGGYNRANLAHAWCAVLEHLLDS